MKKKVPMEKSRAKSMVMVPLYRRRVEKDKSKEAPSFRLNPDDFDGIS